MDEKYLLSRFGGAAALLPTELRAAFEALPDTEKAAAEEIRLRAGRLPSALLAAGEKSVGGRPVQPRELADVLEAATESSLHSAAESLKNGFVTASGGHRVGVCGTAAVRGGEIAALRSVSSLAIRISREMKGVGAETARALTDGGRLRSALIISPPGGGKTTLLRDLVRILSSGREGRRIALADERGEIAAVKLGLPQLDVGPRTDVMSGCPRAEAVLMLLRSMNPEVIAMDEISAERDALALRSAVGCGAAILATAHGASVAELLRRPLYAELIRGGAFETAVVIERKNGGREIHTEELKC